MQLKYLEYAQANPEEMYVQDVEDTPYEERDTSLLRLEPETFDEVWEDAVEALRQRKSVVLSTKNMVRENCDLRETCNITAARERMADMEHGCCLWLDLLPSCLFVLLTCAGTRQRSACH